MTDSNIVADSESAEETEAKREKVDSILSMEEMIKSYIADLERLRSSLKEQSGMLRDALENDADYLAIQEKVKEVAGKKKEIKNKILKIESVAIVDSKVQEIKSEIKETRRVLSDYLERYYRESGLRQITGADGEIMEIVTSVKLVKKRE